MTGCGSRSRCRNCRRGHRRWDTYYILPAGASYVGDSQVLGSWRDLLGQNVIELADLDAVCETIALTVGLGEDAISLDEGLADLADVGSAAGPGVAGAGRHRRRRVGRRAAVGPPSPRMTWTARGNGGCMTSAGSGL